MTEQLLLSRTGRSHNLLTLLWAAYPGATLVGLDADPRIIALANTKLLNSDVEVVHGDATKPPFEPGSFDRIVSSLVLHVSETYRQRTPFGSMAIYRARRPGQVRSDL